MDPFVGEIRMFGGNYAPVNWATCDGQVIDIMTAEALFALVGTTYGGDGVKTFGLPDLRGRVPVGMGNGPGLTSRPFGQKFGSETAIVSSDNMPSHTHTLQATTAAATTKSPAGMALATTQKPFYSKLAPNVNLAPQAITAQSGTTNQGHNNVQPCFALTFIISLQGIMPERDN